MERISGGPMRLPGVRFRALLVKALRVRGDRRVRSRRVLAGLGFSLLMAASCGPDDRTQLTVRTTLPDDLRDFVESSFEERYPYIDVRFTEGEVAGSLHELQLAADPPPFDVWWGAPGVALERAADAGLLAPHRPQWLRQAGVGEPNAEGLWQVTLVNPFVVAFNREAMALARAPTDWADLFHHRWRDQIYVLDPSRSDDAAYFVGTMVTEAIRDDGDEDIGFEWLDRLDLQVGRYVSEPAAAIRALERQEALLTILPRSEVERSRADGDDWLYYRIPETGTPMLTLGVAMVRGTGAAAAAARFIEHVGSVEVGTEAKLETRWQPAHGSVDMTRIPGGFEIDQRGSAFPLAMDTITSDLQRWLTRWSLEVRGRGK
jgi:iron(III) transport system substrate-binding protein